MKFVLCTFLFFHTVCFAFEITVKSSLNIRTSPNFVGSNNIVGFIKAPSKVQVIEKIQLPSKTMAYKVSISQITPSENVITRGRSTEVWIYGSPSLVEAPSAELPRQEGRIANDRCSDCLAKEKEALTPLRKVLQHIETDQSTAEISIDAKKMVESLTAKGFACDVRLDQIQLRGVQCKGKIDGYPQPVRLYIPKNFVKSEKNKMNIFFHGFETSSNRIFEVLPDNRNGAGDFGGRLADSGRDDTIVVVPESRTRVEGGKTIELTYSKYFQDGDGKNLDQFVKNVQDASGASFPSLSLAAHSGGYLALNSVLGYPSVAQRVKRAALFDGTYSQTTNILSWLNSNRENKLRLSWTTSGEVVTNSLNFIKKTNEKNQIHSSATKGSHMDNIRDGGYSRFLNDD